MLAETVKNYYDEAEVKGEAKGEVAGKAKSLIFILEKKFEPLNEAQKSIIFDLNNEQLMEAMAYIFQAENSENMFRFISALK